MIWGNYHIFRWPVRDSNDVHRSSRAVSGWQSLKIVTGYVGKCTIHEAEIRFFWMIIRIPTMILVRTVRSGSNLPMTSISISGRWHWNQLNVDNRNKNGLGSTETHWEHGTQACRWEECSLGRKRFPGLQYTSVMWVLSGNKMEQKRIVNHTCATQDGTFGWFCLTSWWHPPFLIVFWSPF